MSRATRALLALAGGLAAALALELLAGGDSDPPEAVSPGAAAPAAPPPAAAPDADAAEEALTEFETTLLARPLFSRSSAASCVVCAVFSVSSAAASRSCAVVSL